MSKPDYWVCNGNTAWMDGFLLPKSLVEEFIHKSQFVDELRVERDKYKTILDEYILQLDTYKGLYTQEQESYSILSLEYGKLTIQRDAIFSDLERYKKALDYANSELSESYKFDKVLVISASVAVVSLATGIIIGIYAK